MALRLLAILLLLAPLRANADPTAGSCSCEIRDPGRSQRRTAKLLAAVGLGLGGAAFSVSIYEKVRWTKAHEIYDDPAVDADTRHAAGHDINDAAHVARYLGTGLFAAGTVSLGIATYLYLSAPDKELVLTTAVVPSAGPGHLGVSLVRAF